MIKTIAEYFSDDKLNKRLWHVPVGKNIDLFFYLEVVKIKLSLNRLSQSVSSHLRWLIMSAFQAYLKIEE